MRRRYLRKGGRRAASVISRLWDTCADCDDRCTSSGSVSISTISPNPSHACVLAWTPGVSKSGHGPSVPRNTKSLEICRMARFSARFSMRLTRSLPEPFVFIGRAPRAVQLRNSRRRRPAPESNDPSPLREPLSTRGGWKAILPPGPNLLLQNRLGSREYPAVYTYHINNI